MEVIGNIFFRFGVVRDVVIVFVTCRKWREVFCKYFYFFLFNLNDWFVYRDLLISRLEILII